MSKFQDFGILPDKSDNFSEAKQYVLRWDSSGMGVCQTTNIFFNRLVAGATGGSLAR